MATQQNVREAVFTLLYAYDCGNLDIEKLAPLIFADKKIRHEKEKFAKNLLNLCMENLVQIDTHIKNRLQNWDFSRMGLLERAILRLGICEILHFGTPKPVAINEALELAKKYGDENCAAFVNGILDGAHEGGVKNSAPDPKKSGFFAPKNDEISRGTKNSSRNFYKKPMRQKPAKKS